MPPHENFGMMKRPRLCTKKTYINTRVYKWLTNPLCSLIFLSLECRQLPHRKVICEKGSTDIGVWGSQDLVPGVDFALTTHDSWPRPGHPDNPDAHHSASSWGYTSWVGGTRTQIGYIAQAGWEWRRQWHLLEKEIWKIHSSALWELASNRNQFNVLGDQCYRDYDGTWRHQWALDKNSRWADPGISFRSFIRTTNRDKSDTILEAGKQTDSG